MHPDLEQDDAGSGMDDEDVDGKPDGSRLQSKHEARSALPTRLYINCWKVFGAIAGDPDGPSADPDPLYDTQLDRLRADGFLQPGEHCVACMLSVCMCLAAALTSLA